MRRTHKFFGEKLLQISSSNLHLQRLDHQVCFKSKNLFSTKHSFFTVKVPPLKVKGSLFSTNQNLSCSKEKPISLSRSRDETNNTHKIFSPIEGSSIGRSVIYRCSYLWEKKNETFAKFSLNDLLLNLSGISPESVRRFWRVSNLKPNDVLEILLGFNFDCRKPAIEKRKVGFLWELFNWANDQGKEFQHLPQSYEVMGSMLARVGLLKEAEGVVRTMETQGFLSNCHEVSSEIIEGYVSSRDLENAVSMYKWSRSRGLVVSELCYRVFVQLLIQNKKTKSAFRVYNDMLDVGFKPKNEEITMFEDVVKLLGKEGKIQEARSLVKKVLACGFEPSPAVINVIANGYCEKKDFEDLLTFLCGRKCAPDPSVCNRILSSQCRNFGTREAYIFMEELERLGFRPDEITFGIFISWSCREGKLKDAFVYLSELLSRQRKPDIYAYNALISGLFMKGMWKHVKEIFDEMIGKGETPDIASFRVLLAGYCQFRRFEETKEVIQEMVNRGVVQMASLDDPLSKAFMILGFNPSSIKVKRDNGVGISKTEFFDNLGNGLYLKTDLDDYERTLMGVLEDAMLPDFNRLILKECDHGDVDTALMLKKKMVCRGQKLSLPAYSALIKGLCLSRCHVNEVISLLDEMDEQVYQLDQETLNLMIRAISKKRVAHRGRILLDGMHRKDLSVENETYSVFIMALCKKGSAREVHEFLELVRKDKWLPGLKDCKSLVGCLCQHGMLKEVLELLEKMLETYNDQISDIAITFLEELCAAGFTVVGHVFVEEALRQKQVLDHTVYNHLIRGFCQEKIFHEALRIVDNMLAEDLNPSVDVCRVLIPQLCGLNKPEKAMALKEIMLRKEPTASLSIYNALVNGLCKMGQVKEVTLLYQEMLVKGLSLDSEAYQALIQGYCLDNNWREVRKLIGIMVRNNISLSISNYRNLVILMCMQGKVFNALNLKEYMLGENTLPIMVMHNILIFHLLQTGNNSVVTTLLDEMCRKGFSPDEFTYNFLVYGYYKCKDFTRSVEALKTMIDKDLRPSNRSLRIVISHLCSLGELDKSLELSRVMELKGWIHGSVVQNAIVRDLLSRGRLLEAENFLNRVEENGLVPEGINYDRLIKQLSLHGRPKKAVDLLNIMLKKGNLPDPFSYDSIIQCFCSCNTLNGALDLHAEMLARNMKPSFRSWEMLVHSLCTNGRTTEAESLLDSMVQMGQTPSRSIYQSLIDRYSSENNLNKASEIINRMQSNGYEPDFKTHWSLISNLSNSNNKENSDGEGFLSKLLSFSGFSQKKNHNAKVG